jgi:transposase
MPAKEVSMRKIKEVLRLHFDAKLSQHQIAKSLSLSVGVVNKYLQRFQATGIVWPLPAALEDEAVLRARLQVPAAPSPVKTPALDFSYLHQELKRKGVTLQLLWEEYCQGIAQPLSYSHVCLQYRQWRSQQPKSMRQTHKAGDKCFIDYAGQTMDIIDPDTGEIRPAQIFVGVLGASNYTYAEATWTQQLPDWINSQQRMLEFFGGVPALLVPDNLKSGIHKACRYEPDVNPTYMQFVEHYGTAVLPARPYKPKDKAKVEVGVQIVERWILAKLRHQTFVGLHELNQAIRALVAQLNQKPFKRLPGTRQSVFESVEKSSLRSLPVQRYEYRTYKLARVNMDYHIELEGHYYSVGHTYCKKQVELWYTQTIVECYYQGRCIAKHVRSYQQGGHTTIPEHMPKAHRKHLEWTPGRFMNWAKQIGPYTLQLVQHLLENRPHPEQGYRSCLGLLNLAKRYGEQRLEKACERGWQQGMRSRKSRFCRKKLPVSLC